MPLSPLRRWLAGIALALVLPAAAADVGLPPVDSVFVLSAQATARDRIEVEWKIADGYYLYRHRTSVSADAAFAGAKLALPAGDGFPTSVVCHPVGVWGGGGVVGVDPIVIVTALDVVEAPPLSNAFAVIV